MDLIDRQAALDCFHDWIDKHGNVHTADEIPEYEAIEKLPSAQPERDIPKKPIATTDRAWGIPLRQAVCPKCDRFLGHVTFLGEYIGKRITYCETCGQAIDWEGWDYDE